MALATIFGISFVLELLERAEENAKELYKGVANVYPEAEWIYEDEKSHEMMLLGMPRDEKLRYAGAVVLGKIGAVEMTGTLTGVTLAFDISATPWILLFIAWMIKYGNVSIFGKKL